MNAKRFFYVCAGILLLTIAYSVGAHRADAQSGSSTIVAVANGYPMNSRFVVFAANGDVYSAGGESGPWTHDSNIFFGTATDVGTPGPKSTVNKSWSGAKDAYRKP